MQHLKLTHNNMNKSAYMEKHGNPDLCQFKHSCYLCSKVLNLKQNSVKKHLRAVHSLQLEEYVARFRTELMLERSRRPVIQPSHTLEGWWEGCMYSCKHCPYTVPGWI